MSSHYIPGLYVPEPNRVVTGTTPDGHDHGTVIDRAGTKLMVQWDILGTYTVEESTVWTESSSCAACDEFEDGRYEPADDDDEDDA